MMIKVLGILN